MVGIDRQPNPIESNSTLCQQALHERLERLYFGPQRCYFAVLFRCIRLLRMATVMGG